MNSKERRRHKRRIDRAQRRKRQGAIDTLNCWASLLVRPSFVDASFKAFYNEEKADPRGKHGHRNGLWKDYGHRAATTPYRDLYHPSKEEDGQCDCKPLWRGSTSWEIASRKKKKKKTAKRVVITVLEKVASAQESFLLGLEKDLAKASLKRASVKARAKDYSLGIGV